jgi:hypothetical protein
VLLVGAGPGDPELLTLKAVGALGMADVVLHDDLVPPAILAFVREGASLVPVGKRGGCRSTPQAFIEQLMIREAMAGNAVVRLKGGDPFVFGRGGEEVAALREAGIEVEVVPGLTSTSGLAVPAVVGIPVTHRDMAHGVALVTGHAADGTAEPVGGAREERPHARDLYGRYARGGTRGKTTRRGHGHVPAGGADRARHAAGTERGDQHVGANGASGARGGDLQSSDHRRRRRGGPRRDAARGRRSGSGRLAHRRGRRPYVMQHVEQRADLGVVLALRQVDELQRRFEACTFP